MTALMLTLLATMNDGGNPVAALDLTRALVVTQGPAASPVECTAAVVLAEEVEKRTGVRWKSTSEWSGDSPLVVVTT